MRSVVLLGIALAGCGKGAAECRTYGTELGELLTLAAEEPPPVFSVPDDLQLGLKDDLPRVMLPPGLDIELSPKGVKLAGRMLASTFELSGALAEERDRRLHPYRDGPTAAAVPVDEAERAYFVIDLKTPWPTVVEAFDTARTAGITKPAFVFTATQKLTMPPRAPIDKAIDAAFAKEPAERATEMANILRQVIRECPAVDKAVGDAMRQEGNHALYVAKALPNALTECECRVSKADFRSAMFRLIYMPRPVRALQLATTGPVTRIELPATAVWADAAVQLRPTTKAVELAVAGANGSAGSAGP